MSICPQCDQRLLRVKSEWGLFFHCRQCDGRAVGLSVLRKAIPPQYVKALWVKSHDKGTPRGKACPVCRRAMAEVPVPADGQAVALDVCAGCQMVWFDPREFEQLPKQVRKQPETEQLPLGVREAMAIAELKLDQTRQREGQFGEDGPDEVWKAIPAVLGMPVEVDVNPVRCWPWVTWGLAAVIVAAFLATFTSLLPTVLTYGLIPAECFRYGGLTFVTAFFLHGGVWHLIGNTYFLLIFGDNVEDQLGPWRYVLLIAAASLLGDVAHILVDPHDTTPCIGASGGISGIIVFYALRFPKARLGMIVRYYVFFRWTHFPAWAALIGWSAMQGVLAWMQVSGIGHVSALAHLGGAGVGFGAWLLWRERFADCPEGV